MRTRALSLFQTQKTHAQSGQRKRKWSVRSRCRALLKTNAIALQNQFRVSYYGSCVGPSASSTARSTLRQEPSARGSPQHLAAARSEERAPTSAGSGGRRQQLVSVLPWKPKPHNSSSGSDFVLAPSAPQRTHARIRPSIESLNTGRSTDIPGWGFVGAAAGGPRGTFVLSIEHARQTSPLRPPLPPLFFPSALTPTLDCCNDLIGRPAPK